MSELELEKFIQSHIKKRIRKKSFRTRQSKFGFLL